jgi:4-amino-4-deoxy-L-arabinose transferase-like glycosyltransferase
MRLPPTTLATAFLIAIAVAGLYATRLGLSPIYLMHDESKFSLQAQSIAATGRDLTGHFLPVYFTEEEFPAGRDPLIIYATAIGLKVLPLSEAAVRVPTALLGMLDVVLMFFLSRRLLGSDRMGAVGALLLALTPGHFMRSRLVLSPVFALPFILAWLLSLARFDANGERRDLLAATAWLSVGMYSYLACMVMMPLYLALTVWIVAERRSWLLLPAAAWGFAIPLVPMGLWYATHAERYKQIIDAYRLFNAGQRATEAAPSLGLFETLRLRLDLYWSFFNPDFLFLSGQSSLIDSTRTAGIFPIALAVFMPIGVYVLARGKWGAIGRVIVIGLVTAPLATVISGHIEMNRVLFVIPFGVLTAMYGIDTMLRAKHSGWRWIAMVLLLAVPFQFWGFYRYYMGPYRIASSGYFGGNLREALIDVLARHDGGGGQVYLSRRIPFVDRYWRFYSIAQGRSELIDQATFVDTQAFDAGGAPRGAALVCAASDEACLGLVAPGAWSKVHTASEPDGTPSFAVYERQ